jgi:hypothetical protein
MRGNRTVLVAAGLALLLAPAVALAQAQPREQVVRQPGHTKEWDQAAVTALAGKFAEEIKAARTAFRQVPAPNVGSMQARSHFNLKDLLRVLEREANRLHNSLGEGTGQAELLPAYNRMWITIRDAQEEGRRLMLPKQVDQHFEAAGALLVELDAYFD